MKNNFVFICVHSRLKNYGLSVLACILLLAPLHAETLSPVKLSALTCEHLENPLGIGVRPPRLSWKLRSLRAGEVQTAYEIQADILQPGAAAMDPHPGAIDVWDSGKVLSDQSVLVPWPGKPITSRARVSWRVRVWDKDDHPSEWSERAFFESGLLDSTNEWKAQWITADLPRYDIEQFTLAKSSWINAHSAANQAAAARLVVDLPTNAVIRRAAIDAAADGLITIYVNGQPTRQGASSRTAPLHAETGAQFVPGRNTIAIGSAAVRNAVRRDGAAAGRNAIAAHGTAELEGGQRVEFNTDGSWKAATAPGGNWFTAAFDDSSWSNAAVLASYTSAPSKYSDATIGPGRYLRKAFIAKRGISQARLYATALGVYEASINGRHVSDSRLDPGWTDYNRRVMVQTFDVTKFLSSGTNTLGAVLSDGWYAGRVGWMGPAQYGTRPVFAAQLEINYQDGSREIIATDSSWKAGPGEIVGTDPQWGEIIDARRAAVNWDLPAFDDLLWTNALVEQHPLALDPQRGPPVRPLLELAPQKITRRGAAWIVDFGQNLVGHVRLSARGPAGTTIMMRHAEMLDSEGSLYLENLRPALSTDTFILNAAGTWQTFEPHFTFHGFRYVEISGYPGELTADRLRGIVVGSDTPAVGTWECSDANLNRLYQNIVWGQRGNFLSVPTDCPQRDERMGWMGDAQVFAPTAVRNANVAGFFFKWMVDVNDAQGSNGDFPNYAPRVAQPQAGWPVWGDAGVIIPWVMFIAYGDPAFLADNYPFMERWVEFNARRSNHLILNGGVGDHLAPRRTPIDLVDTAYFANSARILADAAARLGKTNDAAKYKQLQREITEAFNRAFVSTNGTLRSDTQTARILALQFDLLPEHLRDAAARNLAEDIETNGHLTTGFVGVGLVCPALTRIGRSDLAWRLVLSDTYPSWLFSVKNGATTIWERWDGWTPERGFQDAAMNSFNHYSLGSVGEWLYSGAAGIGLDEAHPGYKHFFLRPQFTPRLSYVKASIDSPYGVISSHWHREKDRMIYDAIVPPNTSATLMLPVPAKNVFQSGKPLPAKDTDTTLLNLPAGTYRFSFARELIEPKAAR